MLKGVEVITVAARTAASGSDTLSMRSWRA